MHIRYAARVRSKYLKKVFKGYTMANGIISGVCKLGSCKLGNYHQILVNIVTRYLPLSLSHTHTHSLTHSLTEYSHELYMCSKLDRNGYPTFDLSHDSEAEPTIPFALSITDLRFARVLTKAVAGASQFQPVINSRLLAMIRSKLWRMGKALQERMLPKGS